jgi:hypothetical protein
MPPGTDYVERIVGLDGARFEVVLNNLVRWSRSAAPVRKRYGDCPVNVLRAAALYLDTK